MNLTVAHIKAISRQANNEFVDELVAGMNKHLPAYGIDEFLEVAHFLGQAAVESAYFKTLKEYGNAAYFAKYDGRASLGNTMAGDGARFHGRGIFQLTGRANYKTFGDKIGIDLIANPEKAADPEVSVQLACEYWKGRDLGKYAREDDVFRVSARINGINKRTGEPNHLKERKEYTTKAKTVIKPLFA